MQSFNHRVDKRARVNAASENLDRHVPEQKKIRGRNKVNRPRNGRIAIIPEGDKYVLTEIHYVLDLYISVHIIFTC
jgi:hypothetical protein